MCACSSRTADMLSWFIILGNLSINGSQVLPASGGGPTCSGGGMASSWSSGSCSSLCGAGGSSKTEFASVVVILLYRLWTTPLTREDIRWFPFQLEGRGLVLLKLCCTAHARSFLYKKKVSPCGRVLCLESALICLSLYISISVSHNN